MPLQDDMQLISVDDHVIEPPGVWQDRLPTSMRAEGPRIVEGPSAEGRPPSDVWLYEGQVFPSIGLNAVAGKDRSRVGARSDALRRDAARLLRPRSACGRHGPRRRPGGPQLPDVPPVRGNGLPPGQGSGPGARVRQGVQRLDARRVVCGGARPVDPVHARSARRSRTRRGGGAAHRRQGRPDGHVPREPGAARPAVVPLRSLGSVLGGRAGVRDARVDALRDIGSGDDAEPRRPDGGVDLVDGYEQPGGIRRSAVLARCSTSSRASRSRSPKVASVGCPGCSSASTTRGSATVGIRTTTRRYVRRSWSRTTSTAASSRIAPGSCCATRSASTGSCGRATTRTPTPSSPDPASVPWRRSRTCRTRTCARSSRRTRGGIFRFPR